MPQRLISILLVLLGLPLLPGQHPGGLWYASPSTGTAGCSLEGLRADGTHIGPFPATCGTNAIAHHPLGLIFGHTGYSLEVFNQNGPLGVVVPLAPTVVRMDVGPGGDIWTAETAMVPIPSVTRRDPFGNVLSTTSLGTGTVNFMRADPFGGVWLEFSMGLYRVDASGAVAGPHFVHTFHSEHLEVGPDGGPVVMNSGGAFGFNHLRKFNFDGTLRWIQQIVGIRAFDLDVCGRPHVLVENAGIQEIHVLNPDDGGTLRVIQLPYPFTPTLRHLAIDTAQRYWTIVTTTPNSPAAIRVFDRDGVLLNSLVASGPMSSTYYEMTAVHLVSVVDPTGDTDHDGVANDIEIRAGSDPVDPASVATALSASGNIASGGTIVIGTSIPQDAGFAYAFAASFGTGGISLLPLDCRSIPLDLDPLFTFWLSPTNPFAAGRFGVVDPNGVAAMTVTLPSGLPTGLSLSFALATFAPSGSIGTISLPLTLTL